MASPKLQEAACILAKNGDLQNREANYLVDLRTSEALDSFLKSIDARIRAAQSDPEGKTYQHPPYGRARQWCLVACLLVDNC